MLAITYSFIDCCTGYQFGIYDSDLPILGPLTVGDVYYVQGTLKVAPFTNYAGCAQITSDTGGVSLPHYDHLNLTFYGVTCDTPTILSGCTDQYNVPSSTPTPFPTVTPSPADCCGLL